MKKIVIIGAGFSGQGIVKKLYRDKRFQITLIDQNSYISYKPLYPDVASGRLPAHVIEYSLEAYARQYRCDAIVGEVRHIDHERNMVIVGQMNVSYDFLVIATGVQASFYGQYHFRENVYTLDSSKQCRAVQERLYYLMKTKTTPVSISIIGGGYTGIEFATHVRQYFEYNGKQVDIRVIESQQNILNGLSDIVIKRTTEHIISHDIKILTRKKVVDIKSGIVVLEDEILPSDLIVWTAGMEGQGISIPGLIEKTTSNGRIEIDETARVSGTNNIFVAGDIASKYRMSVPFAKQYAGYIAKTIKRLVSGKNIVPFHAKDYGYVIAFADKRGIGYLNGLFIDGVFGYLFHYVMCMLSLLGSENKLALIRAVARNRTLNHHKSSKITDKASVKV